MPGFLDNYNLGWIQNEGQDAMQGFSIYAVEKGRRIDGYNGIPSFCCSFGDAEIHAFLEGIDQKTGKASSIRLETHSAGSCVWDLISTGIDLTPYDADITEKCMVFKTVDESIIPIELLHADVIPCYLEGERIKVQVVGEPMTIRYYACADDYENTLLQKDDKTLFAQDKLFPRSLLLNHIVEGKTDESKDPIKGDSVVHFCGTVKKLGLGKVLMEDEEGTPFIRCYIDTQFGKLQIDHSYLQVPEDQRKNIRVGAFVEGDCVLSGDVAINKYESGIVKDHEHDLAALRSVVEKEVRAEHLKSILAKNAEYTSVSWKKAYTGPEEIIGLLNHIQDAQETESIKGLTLYAVITSKATDDLPHEVGERCLILSYGDPDKNASIIFISVDKEGMITIIDVTNDNRYRFQIESQKIELTTAEITLIEESARAKTGKDMVHGMIKCLHQSGIDAQEVLDNLYKMTPPYSDVHIAKAMADTLDNHPEK